VKLNEGMLPVLILKKNNPASPLRLRTNQNAPHALKAREHLLGPDIPEEFFIGWKKAQCSGRLR
jgi:hypothetical protein